MYLFNTLINISEEFKEITEVFKYPLDAQKDKKQIKLFLYYI